jgi:hypothetical protein
MVSKTKLLTLVKNLAWPDLEGALNESPEVLA